MCFDFFGARINMCLTEWRSPSVKHMFMRDQKVETRDAEVTEEERLFY